jgi:tRNA(Arg) A34 adenosine deaminase TadA
MFLVGILPCAQQRKAHAHHTSPHGCNSTHRTRAAHISRACRRPASQSARARPAGNRLFGGAIVRKADLSLVIADTNMAAENPVWHGEVHALKRFFELPVDTRPDLKDCWFIATHEPCSLCLSAITWAGLENFSYLFRCLLPCALCL